MSDPKHALSLHCLISLSVLIIINILIECSQQNKLKEARKYRASKLRQLNIKFKVLELQTSNNNSVMHLMEVMKNQC